MKYSYNKETGVITFDQKISKRHKGAIKLYFYRGVDEREMSDYPIATCDGNGTNEYYWLKDYAILTVHFKRPRFFGLFGHRWEVCEEIPSLST